MSTASQHGDASIEVVLDARAYSIDAAQRAAYRLSQQMTMEVAVAGDTLVCQLFPVDATQADALTHSFRRTVNDEVLRERIRTETEPVRNTILALAFSRVDLDERAD